MDQVRVFRPQVKEASSTTQTSGMIREQLVSTPNSWVGMVRITPGSLSDWHHHAEYDTYVYVISGMIRFEHGPKGAEICDVTSGEVGHVPKHLVHRESNPSSEDGVAFVVRAGTGEPVFNVDGPDS